MTYGYHHHAMLWLSAVIIVFAGSMNIVNFGYTATAAGPAIRNVRATDITLTDAAIRWDTDVPSDSQISYGPTSAEGYLAPVNNFFTTSHAVTLTGLQYSATYHYSVISKDMNGNSSQSADQQFTTPVNTPTTFPFLAYSWLPIYNSTGTAQGNWYAASDGLREDNIAPNQYYPLVASTMDDTGDFDIQATVSFRSGAELGVCARMNIWGFGYCFGTSASGDTRILFFPQTTSTPVVLATGIKFPIAQNMDYKVKVRARGYAIYGKIYSATSTEPSEWNVITTDATSAYQKGKVGFYTLLTQPSIKTLVVGPIANDPQDTTPPSISLIAASAGTISATVSWTTDEYADTQVEYGTSAAYGSQTVLDTSPALNHLAALANLTPNTTYHYRVKSKDLGGNMSVSNDAQFVTSPIPSSISVPSAPSVASSTPASSVPASSTANVPPLVTVPVQTSSLSQISPSTPQPAPSFPVSPSVSASDLRKDALALRRIKARLPNLIRSLTVLSAFVDLEKRAGIAVDVSQSSAFANARSLALKIQKGKKYADVRDSLVVLPSAVRAINEMIPTLRRDTHFDAVSSRSFKRLLRARVRTVAPISIAPIEKDIH